MTDAGFTLRECDRAGFSKAEMGDAFVDAREWKVAGMTAADAKAAGFGAAACAIAGYRAKACREGGYGVNELWGPCAPDVRRATWPLNAVEAKAAVMCDGKFAEVARCDGNVAWLSFDDASSSDARELSIGAEPLRLVRFPNEKDCAFVCDANDGDDDMFCAPNTPDAPTTVDLDV